MKTPAETRLGLFVVVGIGIIAFLSLRLGHHKMKPANSSVFYAEFNSVDGLEKGTDVEVAGVKVGEVDDITLSTVGKAKVKMLVKKILCFPPMRRRSFFRTGFLERFISRLNRDLPGSDLI